MNTLCFAGDLDDYETSSSQSTTSISATKERAESSCLGLATMFVCLFNNFINDVIGQGVTRSFERTAWPPMSSPSPDQNSHLRARGDPLLPFVRLDIALQQTTVDVNATDFLGEVGYGGFAITSRYTDFTEASPPDQMRIWHTAFLFRLSPSDRAEIEAGAGFSKLIGNQKHDGINIMLSLLAKVQSNIQVELRPTWINFNGIYSRDYDADVLLGGHFASLKLGYRRMHASTKSLEGPYIGLVFLW